MSFEDGGVVLRMDTYSMYVIVPSSYMSHVFMSSQEVLADVGSVRVLFPIRQI